MSRFGSAEDFLKALKETKLRYVGVPSDWDFAGTVKILKIGRYSNSGEEGFVDEFLEVKGERFAIVATLPGMVVIQIPSN